MDFQLTLLLLAWVAIVLLGFVVAGLVRRVHALSSGGRIEEASLGPAIGGPAPHIDRFADRPSPLVLLFLDTTCGSCERVLKQADSIDDLDIAALYAGTPPADAPAGVRVFGDQDDLFTEYGVPAVPFAVLVDEAGRVRDAQPVGSPGALAKITSNGGTA